MKKLLILILILLLIILGGVIGVKGTNIAGVEILSVEGIQTKSNQLDQKIQQATKLAEKDYIQAVDNVNSDAKKLKETKQDYLDMTEISSESDIQAATYLKEYEMEKLWVQIGNHATSNGVDIKMAVTPGTSGAEGTYNLNFTATGGYVQIEEFISSIENDSTLGFKIEEFRMTPDGNNLKATFVCRDIPIKEISAVENTENKDNADGTNGTAESTNLSTNSSSTNTTNTSN